MLGDSQELPAGPALGLQLALPAQTRQPAVALDAESTESGEILSAGLHDVRAALVVSSAAPAGLFVLAVGFSSNACGYCHAEGCGRHRRSVLLDGGRLKNEGSLAAHGYQRFKLKCTFHVSCC